MNSEFSVVIYILCLLAMNEKERLTSTQISERIHVHPARIRKMLMNIKKHGYVETKEGFDGGYVLTKKPEEINLKDLYTMINSKPLQIPKSSLRDEQSLPSIVDSRLESIFLACEKQIMEKLEEVSLANFIDGKLVL